MTQTVRNSTAPAGERPTAAPPPAVENSPGQPEPALSAAAAGSDPGVAYSRRHARDPQGIAGADYPRPITAATEPTWSGTKYMMATEASVELDRSDPWAAPWKQQQQQRLQ